MSLPTVVAVAAGSPAELVGLRPGDEIVARSAGQVPRDVIQFRLLADDADVELDVRRGGLDLTLLVEKDAGEPLGAEVSSALFDRIRTCDNHCEFCFIYQLPKGMRPSLYLKDDDYRLSFLYGNFTTLTRFTEADLERVRHRGPLAAVRLDPRHRPRGARRRCSATGGEPRACGGSRPSSTHGIEVHGQVVVCPGQNDGAVLEQTFAGVLDRFPASPTGVRAARRQPPRRRARPAPSHGRRGRGRRRPRRGVAGHLPGVPSAAGWSACPTSTTCWPAGRSPAPRSTRASPSTRTASGWRQRWRLECLGATDVPLGPRGGFFQSVDGAPAERLPGRPQPRIDPAPPDQDAPVCRRDRPLRRPGAPTPPRRHRPRRRPRRRGPQRLLRRQHCRGRPPGRRGPPAGPGQPSPRATATSCRMCA